MHSSYESEEQFISINIKYYSAYFEALFWADIDGNDDVDNSEGLGVCDIEPSCLKKQIEELDEFFNLTDEIFEKTDYTHNQACHDFYFTRQGHGVGFWENDHCEKKEGAELTEIAQKFGVVCPHISEGKIYID